MIHARELVLAIRRTLIAIPPRPLLGLAALSLSSLALAQSGASGEPSIGIIEVKGQALLGDDSAWSSSSFSAADIRDKKLTDTQEVFKSVPGMNILHYGLPGVADTISIRGFGGGGHGGDLGVVIDGIPLNEAMSHADGYVDMGVVVPLEIGAMTVFKGPVSALYGNYNRGGLVSLETRKTSDYGEMDLRLGTDETADVQAAWGTKVGNNQQLNFAGQVYRSNGFRPQTDAERATLSGRWKADITPRFSLAVSSRLHKAESDGASYLTAAQYHNDPYGIDARAQNDGADKNFATLRIDSNYAMSDTLRLLAFAYGTGQDFSRWFTRPTGAGVWKQREESYDRKVRGAGFSFNGQQSYNGLPLNWVAGVEAFRESTDYIYYDNLQHRQSIAPPITNRETSLNSESAFAELQTDVHSLFMPSIGVRYDRFRGGCDLNGVEMGNDPCGSLNDMSNVSPKLGFRSALSDQLMLRASWSEGFALPNGFVKYTQSARNLDPVIFRQKELGLNYRASNTLSFDMVAYQLRSSDEVRTVAPGIFENFGATERSGVETSVSWLATQDLELVWIYGTADSEILSNANAAVVGNKIGGVAEYNSNLMLNWNITPTLAFEGSWRTIGGYSLNASNVDSADSYAVLDMGLNYTDSRLPGWRFNVNVDNVADKRFATAVFVIGGERVVAPGNPRLIQVGAQFQF